MEESVSLGDVVHLKEEVVSKKIYPLVEEMIFRSVIGSEQEGYSLLRAVQILVNELGASSIIAVVDAIEKKPQLIQKAKSYLPLISML